MASLAELFSCNSLRRGEYHLLQPALRPPPRTYRRFVFRLCYYLLILLGIITILLCFTAAAYPSYTHPPTHYSSLRRQVSKSEQSGRGNIRNEKVFIAASLHDPTGELARGAWGTGILQLIILLGEENVFVSIYENEIEDKDKSGLPRSTSKQSSDARLALEHLSARIPYNKSIVYERLDLDQLPTVVIPATGEKRVKRITYLAETRNRALRPLDSSSDSDSDNDEMRSTTPTRFDKLLFLNDVAFDPIDALQLLFSTNADSNGIAQYRAACAVDFINLFKFYDTYATRDQEGYSMGLPFFPWFSTAGSGQSRQAVLAGSDSVPVRSCWGGMVAFDARYFQNGSSNSLVAATEGEEAAAAGDLPARFRALTDPDYRWDASECCLIHADIQRPPINDEAGDTGVYMNPFVRVAYDTTTLSWLSTTRRVERLYSGVQRIGNYLVGLPWYNPRREDQVGGFDGFCGRRGRGLQVVVPRRERGKGWKTIP
ncbi:cryptococcal mannosyltransferase 1-domain-containing protein [Aspergillus germanicus]